MPDPFNYILPQQQQNPLQSLMSGMQLGNALQTARLQQMQQMQQQQDFAALANNPNASADDISRMMLKYPNMVEPLKAASAGLDQARKQSFLTHASEVYAALASGKPEVAQQVLTDYATAQRNSGDTAGAQHTDAMAKMAKISPNSAKLMAGMSIAAITGPDKFAETFAKVGEEARKAETYNPEQEVAQKTANLEKTQAETGKAVAETPSPERIAADLGLTKAQTNKAIVEGKKISAETTKTLLETQNLINNNGLDPSKKFEQEEKLRDDVNKLMMPIRDVQASYQRIQSSEKTAAGDLAMIFNFMKMLDPTSVVREGEFATAQNSGGIPQRVQNAYNRALNGERLTEGQRRDFLSQAGSLFAGTQAQEKELRKGMSRIAKAYNLSPENIFVSPEGLSTPQPQGNAALNPSGAPAAKPKNITVNY